MRCCGLRPQARSRASPPPPPRPSSSHFRLSHYLNKFSPPNPASLSSPPPPPRRRPSFHLLLSPFLKKSPPPPPPPPPAALLHSFLPLLHNFDGVDLHSLLAPPAPSSSSPSPPIDHLPPSQPSRHPPILEVDRNIAGSGFPLVDAKLNAAFGDLSSDSTVGSARRERSCGWAYVIDRTMGNVVTRAAFLGATTGAVVVGRVALVGATMTLAMACSSLQMIRRAWDSSSGKVTPLPPPHQLPQVAISDSITPRSDSICETVQASSSFSETPPNEAANSPSSPRCVKHLEDKLEDRTLTPCIFAHSLDLAGAVGDRPSSTLDSPLRPFLNRASRMGNSLERKHSRKSARGLRNQIPERSDANLLRAEQRNPSSLGLYLATIGLLLGLSGLFVGRILAVLVVVCWLYATPRLKQTAVEKLAVVSINIEEAGKADQKRKKRNSSSALSTRGRRPSDYRKRVIMEGILERGHRPTIV